MAAPFAAAVVSASKGLTTLTNEYMAGSISSAEYFDLGMCLCAESAIVGLATAAGQAVIPVPVLGGIIGSIPGRMMLQLAQGLDTKHLLQYQGFRTQDLIPRTRHHVLCTEYLTQQHAGGLQR